MISKVYSIKSVERQYATGEEPVLVLCSDMSEYICKYARTNGAAHKLVSELIGSMLAQSWGLNTPPSAFVKIRSGHWAKAGNNDIFAFGSRKINKVIDINPSTISNIVPTPKVLFDILNIALFDLWVANEDRNANNANLMYDIEHGSLVSIDYGCIFNTAMYDYPMSQLTSTDTILASDLFTGVQKGGPIDKTAQKVLGNFNNSISQCKRTASNILRVLPEQWGVPCDFVQTKINQLFDRRWCDSVLNNFNEYLLENRIS